MQLEATEDGYQIDAVDLGPLLGIPAEDVQRLMLEGRISSLSEKGQGDDRGRHRITFRHGGTRVRLTVNDDGEVLLRTRTTVAPQLRARPRGGLRPADKVQRAPGRAVDDGLVDLTQRLEAHFHPQHRRRLHQLGKLAEMVEDLHEGDEGVPAGLHQIIARISGVLEAHMQTAESVIFPAIRMGEASGLESRIDALRSDRARLERNCARIRETCRDFKLPNEACTSWATLYAGLHEFTDDLGEHIRLEKDLLFPRFEGVA